MDQQLYIRISRYASAYDVNRKTVYKWIDAGLVDIMRVGSLIRVKNTPPSDRRGAIGSQREFSTIASQEGR